MTLRWLGFFAVGFLVACGLVVPASASPYPTEASWPPLSISIPINTSSTGSIFLSVGVTPNFTDVELFSATVSSITGSGFTNGGFVFTSGCFNNACYVDYNFAPTVPGVSTFDVTLNYDEVDLSNISNSYVNSESHTYTFSAYDPAATPLPAALPLFASGLGAFGFLSWRRKRKAQAAA
jgi:hypothetical protein